MDKQDNPNEYTPEILRGSKYLKYNHPVGSTSNFDNSNTTISTTGGAPLFIEGNPGAANAFVFPAPYPADSDIYSALRDIANGNLENAIQRDLLDQGQSIRSFQFILEKYMSPLTRLLNAKMKGDSKNPSMEIITRSAFVKRAPEGKTEFRFQIISRNKGSLTDDTILLKRDIVMPVDSIALGDNLGFSEDRPQKLAFFSGLILTTFQEALDTVVGVGISALLFSEGKEDDLYRISSMTKEESEKFAQKGVVTLKDKVLQLLEKDYNLSEDKMNSPAWKYKTEELKELIEMAIADLEN